MSADHKAAIARPRFFPFTPPRASQRPEGPATLASTSCQGNRRVPEPEKSLKIKDTMSRFFSSEPENLLKMGHLAKTVEARKPHDNLSW
jgi:hypothetical protein